MVPSFVIFSVILVWWLLAKPFKMLQLITIDCSNQNSSPGLAILVSNKMMLYYLLLIWTNDVYLLCFAFIVSEYGNNFNTVAVALSVML